MNRGSHTERAIQAINRHENEIAPAYFYKYQNVDAAKIKNKQLDKDHSIKALFECNRTYSSRLNFNDLFDSKVKLIYPTPEQILATPNISKSVISNDQLTEDGNNLIQFWVDGLNDFIDSHAFFCLSKNSKSNLMWSHYAGSHQGFCIEFKLEHISTDNVEYQKEIPEIELIEFFNPDNHEALSIKIWQCLRTKLIEWKYEEEYRLQFGDYLPKGTKFVTVKYDPKSVESIIFGCRTPDYVKEYIIHNIPYDVKFKKAIELDSSIDIVDY